MIRRGCRGTVSKRDAGKRISVRVAGRTRSDPVGRDRTRSDGVAGAVGRSRARSDAVGRSRARAAPRCGRCGNQLKRERKGKGMSVASLGVLCSMGRKGWRRTAAEGEARGWTSDTSGDGGKPGHGLVALDLRAPASRRNVLSLF